MRPDMFDLSTVNRKELFYYLGMKATDSPGEEMASLAEDCLRELSGQVSPGCVRRVYPLRIVDTARPQAADNSGAGAERAADAVEAPVPEIPEIDIGGLFTVRSKSLFANLRGCDEVLLFAATLGAGPDLLIRRYEKIRMSRAVVCQAAAGAMIEAYIESQVKQWEKAFAAEGKRLRPRFSCGYGDFGLENQRHFMDVLEMEKRLGIRLSEGNLMMPSKSVTALIGIENYPEGTC